MKKHAHLRLRLHPLHCSLALFSHPLRCSLALCTLPALSLGCSGAVSETDVRALTAQPDAGGLAFVPVGVETIAVSKVVAGRLLPVSCLPVDADGDLYGGTHDFVTEVHIDRPEALSEQASGLYLAQLAGETAVHCAIPALDLTDETPAQVTVTAGDPALVRTILEKESINAGTEVEVECVGEDRFGNAIPDLQADVRVAPQVDTTAIAEHTLHIERAQRYEVVCEHRRAKTVAAALQVEPGPVDELRLSAVPRLRAHYPGDVLNIVAEANDKYGNAIEAFAVEFATDTTDGVEREGESGFRFQEEGKHRITATVKNVAPDTQAIGASLEVLIDGQLPAIRCEYPQDGHTMQAPTPGMVDFRGAVSDENGIEAVAVNGEALDLAGDEFHLDLETKYGVNLAMIDATDSAGRTSSRLCAFLVAPQWLAADRTAAHSVSLQLPARAFDDGSRTGTLNSLTDLLDTALRSKALRDTVHAQLIDNPVLKPSACDESILGGCILRSQILYENIQIMGEPAISVALVDDGLATDVTLRGLRLNLRARGHVAGIDYDSRGTVTIREIRARATFDTGLSAGKPKVSLRAGTVSASASGVDTDFAGTDGAVIDIVGDLFNGSVRGLIADAVRGVVTDQVADVLSDSLNGIDLASLETTLKVTKPLTDTVIPTKLGLNFSSLDTTSERMRFTLGTRVTTSAGQDLPTLGAPARKAPTATDAGSATATVLAIHEALASQIVSALWQAGLFELDVDGDQIDGLLNGLKGHVSVGMPPVVELIDGRARISAGAVHVELTHPQLLDGDLIQLQVAAQVSAKLGLTGRELHLDDFQLDLVTFSTDRPDLGFSATQDFQRYLSELFERMLSPVLAEAFPKLLIPGLMLPEATARFSIPDMATLGLLKPDLSIVPPRAVLSGNFGLQ